MNVGGLSLRDHIRLLAPLFGLIAAVWLLRLVLATAGAPGGLVSVVSVTAAVAISVLLAVLLIHFRRAGSYANVVFSVALLVLFEELLIVAAIGFAVLTGTGNIFTAPEYSFPHADPSQIRHILGHLTFGVGLGTLFGSGMGCLLLWILRRSTLKP
ncbi:MAG TPA: hypothetical protein VGL91_10350 [Acidobacteriota bacterium]|jgi:hypothetical protein